jgi:hypothetical protein
MSEPASQGTDGGGSPVFLDGGFPYSRLRSALPVSARCGPDPPCLLPLDGRSPVEFPSSPERTVLHAGPFGRVGVLFPLLIAKEHSRDFAQNPWSVAESEYQQG